ncbi:ABC transporter permease [Salinicoccus sp. ID82-1]|uniref:YhgE/Pip domain-containing protein n=1 Tax=Salinicoccus sp. ID82-1 TaxID=2820269 RepID=UPI001F421DFB|nr:ABC transporter permease [Salinicoccus sp. ID82-1]
MSFKKFLGTKGAIATIFMGVFYAVAMLGIFLPGYSAIPGNIDQLHIAIVNEDAGEYGGEIADQLEENLPFKEIATDLTNEQAMNDLEHNGLAMVVHIPETFSEDVAGGKGNAAIDFTTNEAAPQMVSSTMTSIVSEINNQLGMQFSQQTAQGVLMNFNVPEAQAAELSAQIESAYVGNVVSINEVPDGMNNSMLPMFLTMAGYTGAMIGAMQLISAYRENRAKASRTRLFIYVQMTALIVAVTSTLIAMGIVYLINGPSADLLLELAGQQVLNYVVAFNFTAILVFLVGEAGMIFNLPILLMQTLANGSTMPRDLMYAPYEWMSHISPMYYSVQAYTANLYGSISAGPFLWSMAAIGGIAMLINIMIVAFVHKPVELDTPVADDSKMPTPAEVTP